jgi:hypothetical protein
MAKHMIKEERLNRYVNKKRIDMKRIINESFDKISYISIKKVV